MTTDVITTIAPFVSSVIGGVVYLVIHFHNKEAARNERDHDKLRDRINDHETRISKIEIKLDMLKDD